MANRDARQALLGGLLVSTMAALLALLPWWQQPWMVHLDHAVLAAAQRWRHPTLAWWLVHFTATGSAWTVVALTALLCLGLARWERRGIWLQAAFFVAGAALAGRLLKSWIGRSRPPVQFAAYVAEGYSFPSGHSTMTAAFALLLWQLQRRRQLLLPRWALGAVLVWAVAIGLSRPLLGVHYVSDVLMAWGLTLAWAYVYWHWRPWPEPCRRVGAALGAGAPALAAERKEG
ncbi:MAG: phosphatase PAP2 family protein [Polyangiales bacterium]